MDKLFFFPWDFFPQCLSSFIAVMYLIFRSNNNKCSFEMGFFFLKKNVSFFFYFVCGENKKRRHLKPKIENEEQQQKK